MSRYIRYKYQKQQINYLNCNDLDKWIDTCQTRLTGFDSICSGSCNCTTYGNDESEVIYSYKKLNPNYSYDCLDGNRYYKLQKQVSYDGGLTYIDLDEYETGDLYESNSPFCSAETVLMDWFESDNYCVGTDLYKREVKRVSFDGGNTWSDMGYTDENGVTTYEYRSSKIESNSCNCINIGDTLSFRWSGDTCNFSINYSVPNKSVSVTVTKEDCIDNGDGTYTYRSNMRDIGVDEVTSLSYLFRNNFGLIEVYELPKGDITNMNSMFINNSNLKTFDKNILPNTSKVTTMGTMFSSCGMLTSLDLSGIDTSNVTNMYSMFSGCGSLTSLDLSGWNTSKVTNMYTMFNGCGNLKTLNVSGWDVQQVTIYSYMLQNCKNIEQLIIGETDEETYNWWCERLKEASISCNIIECTIIGKTLSFEFTGDTTTYKLNDTTYTATSSPYSTTLTDLGIETLTSCKNTFRGSSITNLVSFLNTSNVSDMSYMFYLCSGLTSLNVSSFDTSNVRNMYLMFADCSGLTSLDLSNFNTSNVTSMGYMFTNCISLTNLDLSNFDTSNVTGMRDMFRSCISLTNLDLSNFDTSEVTNMINMFAYCSSLKTLNVSSWDVSKVTTYDDDMFKGCTSLQTLKIKQGTRDWWYARLTDASIQNNVTIIEV